jgi:hypothetical protein
MAVNRNQRSAQPQDSKMAGGYLGEAAQEEG